MRRKGGEKGEEEEGGSEERGRCGSSGTTLHGGCCAACVCTHVYVCITRVENMARGDGKTFTTCPLFYPRIMALVSWLKM